MWIASRPSAGSATSPDMDGSELEERVASAGAAGAPSSSGADDYDSHEAEAIIASLRERVLWLEDRLREKVRRYCSKLHPQSQGFDSAASSGVFAAAIGSFRSRKERSLFSVERKSFRFSIQKQAWVWPVLLWQTLAEKVRKVRLD
jgi:hypothetical protein